MDADAGELCAMIDKRLPDLIDHELDSLAPDSRGRDRQVGELVDLVEQFVRHCGAKRDGAAIDSRPIRPKCSSAGSRRDWPTTRRS